MSSQFDDERPQKMLDLFAGLQAEFLAQLTALVVKAVIVLVLVDHPDTILRKAEAKQAAQVEVESRKIGIVLPQVIDHPETGLVDDILDIRKGILRIRIDDDIFLELFVEQGRFSFVEPGVVDERLTLRADS